MTSDSISLQVDIMKNPPQTKIPVVVSNSNSSEIPGRQITYGDVLTKLRTREQWLNFFRFYGTNTLLEINL